MAQYRVQDPTGKERIIEGPDGATDEEILAQAQTLFPAKESVRDSFRKNMASMFAKDDAADVERRKELGEGIKSTLQGGGQLLYNAMPEGVQQASDTANKWLYEKTGGTLGTQDDQNAFVEQQAKARGDSFSFPRMVGSALVGAPITAALGPGILPSVAAGAATSMLEPVREGKDYWNTKLWQGGVGGVLSGALGAAAKLAKGVLAPGLEQTPAAERLMAEGVQPSVGQRFGGELGILEEKLTSAPVVGDYIAGARKGAVNQFNEATINRALRPLDAAAYAPKRMGELTGNIGAEAVDTASRAVSDRYDLAKDLIGNVELNKPELRELVKTMKDSSQFMNPGDKSTFERITRAGIRKIQRSADPTRATQEFMSNLGAARGKMSYNNADMGNAVGSIKDKLLDIATRQNPEAGAALQEANSAFANMTRVVDASKRAGGQPFSPNQLMGAVRGMDTSVRKNAVGRGTALMQDWAMDGVEALGGKIPDSGSTGRYGLLHMIMHPESLMSAPAATLAVIGSLAKTPERQQDVANWLMRSDSPITEAIRQMTINSGAAVTGQGIGR